MAVEIVHWNPAKPVVRGRIGRRLPFKRPVNNFGDLLGPLLVDRLVHSQGIAQSRGEGRLLTVGSIMSLARAGDTVWGTGVNGKSMKVGPAPELDIRAVRGPLTRRALVEAGARVPEIYGDPALLIPRHFPVEVPRRRAGVVVVPNLHDWWALRRDPRVISPRQPFEQILARIISSELVVGSSLHGVVIAEAYGIPARFVTSGTEPPFKYHDYYLGTGRPATVRMATSVDEAVDLGGAPAPDWDPEPLVDAFPWELWTSSG